MISTRGNKMQQIISKLEEERLHANLPYRKTKATLVAEEYKERRPRLATMAEYELPLTIHKNAMNKSTIHERNAWIALLKHSKIKNADDLETKMRSVEVKLLAIIRNFVSNKERWMKQSKRWNKEAKKYYYPILTKKRVELKKLRSQILCFEYVAKEMGVNLRRKLGYFKDSRVAIPTIEIVKEKDFEQYLTLLRV